MALATPLSDCLEKISSLYVKCGTGQDLAEKCVNFIFAHQTKLISTQPQFLSELAPESFYTGGFQYVRAMGRQAEGFSTSKNRPTSID